MREEMPLVIENPLFWWGQHDYRDVKAAEDKLEAAGFDFSERMERLLTLFPISNEEEEAFLSAINNEDRLRSLIDPEYQKTTILVNAAIQAAIDKATSGC